MAINGEQFRIYLGVALDEKGKTTLNKEIQELTKHEVNLKVGLDDNSLKELKTSIDGVTEQLKKMGSLSSSVGKGIAKGFQEGEKGLTSFQENLRKVTQEYKEGKKTAEEYAKHIQKLMLNKDGDLNKHALKMDTADLESYLKLISQIQTVKPIGEQVNSKSISIMTDSGLELVKTIDTYKDKLGQTQTIVSHMSKETGTLIASQVTLTTNDEKRAKQLENQTLKVEKQATALEKYKQLVSDINQFGIDMIKSGNATSKDNEMIKNANLIKKEHQELLSLNQQGVLIDETRVQKFKTMLAEQSNYIRSKDAEISKNKQVEDSLYRQSKLVEAWQKGIDSTNTKFSSGVNDKDSQAIQELLNSYAKLNPTQENFKRKTEEVKLAVQEYNRTVKETATAEQKQQVSLAQQATALEKYKSKVQEINQFGIDMIKGGNATNADNGMINNANAIKKEFETLNKLNQDGVVIDNVRLEGFKRLLVQQDALIKAKNKEISIDKQLEQDIYDRDRLVKQMTEKVSSQNTSYSSGVNEKDSQAIQQLIDSYSKLNPAQANMKRETDALKDSVNAYLETVKNTATQEQKEFVAKEKHAIAIQKLQNAFSNTNNKYALGIDDKASSAMKDQINAFKELDPLADGYAQDLERIRVALAQYTVDTRNSTKEVSAQIANINRLNSIQASFEGYKGKTQGFYDADEADEITQTMNQMRQLIASGQDVSLMFGSLINNVRGFGQESTQAMQKAKKDLNEEQKLLLYKEKMLFDIAKLENEYGKKGMSTQPLEALKQKVVELGVVTENTTFEQKKLSEELRQAKGLASMEALNKSMRSILQTATGFYGLYSVFGYIREGFSSLIREATALDSAMIGLKRVTDETQSTYEAFKRSTFEVVDAIGGTAKEIIDSTSEFAKLGYSFKEASELAVSATKYATVGEIGLAEATDALSASYTVFGKTFDETMGKMTDSSSIIDLYNKIGKLFSIA